MASIAKSGSASDGPNENQDRREDAPTNQGNNATSEAQEPERANCDEKVSKEEAKHSNPPKGLPPIDLDELNTVLRHPNMPSKKILHEVADKVISDMNRGEARFREMKGLFDCILEVSLKQTDEESDNSDDEAEEDSSFHLEFPCVYCEKVFFSSMEMKTHVLVLHSKEDPSILNRRRISQGHRNRSQDSVKAASDLTEKPPQSLRVDEKPIPNVGDENVPVNPQLSRSHLKLSKGPSGRSGSSLPDSQSKSKGMPSAVESSVVVPERQVGNPSSELPVAEPTTESRKSVGKDSLQTFTSSQRTGEDSGNNQTDILSRVTVEQTSTSKEQEDQVTGKSECAVQQDGSNVSRKRESTGDEDKSSAAKRERRTRSRQEDNEGFNS